MKKGIETGKSGEEGRGGGGSQEKKKEKEEREGNPAPRETGERSESGRQIPIQS